MLQNINLEFKNVVDSNNNIFMFWFYVQSSMQHSLPTVYYSVIVNNY